jgi:serine/threonine protein kinase
MELIAMLKDLTHGISYIHSNGVIHRDIKIDNVILKHNVCKITDFGVSSVGEISQTFVGTPVYLAPEIMNNRVYNDAYDKTVDIWALGVLAFEAYFRINPFFYHGSRLMTFSDFEVITDNIMNICIPEFDIKNVIKMIRKENMEKEANFIVKKLQKTSKHLIFLFKKFFEFEPQKRAKT